MNKFLLLPLLGLVLSIHVDAQKTKDKKKSLDDFDSTAVLREMATVACQCIDSVDKAEPDKAKKVAAVPDCIDRQVDAYQLISKLMSSMKSGAGDKKITINIGDKNTDEYKHYYYDIERWLKDSCAVMNKIISTNDIERDKSFSKNKDAMAAYNNGIPFLQKEDYASATPFFEKAVSIDPEFAFAWDNLGICYRRTGKYEKAEAAYKASLKVDPDGKAPLQNLPVVYQLQKKYDEAIAAYNDLLAHYPNDPEVYYGIGLIYFSGKNDMENALKNLCKAYNIYVEQKSPYRSDAEKVINMVYSQMKKDGKEDVFNQILKENNIKSN